MEEDIKILEEYIKHDTDLVNLPEYDAKIVYKAIENLIARYKELEEENEQLEAIKNEAIRRYNFESIPVSKVKEKIEELSDKDLEIYETDSEDVIISKYEDRAVLDFCNSILED